MTSPRLRILASILAALVLLVTGGVIGFQWALRHVPEFYTEALETDPDRQAAASDEMLATATALISNAQQKNHWSALFTTEQVNGWLAVDLPRNFPELLPPEIVEPRVMLTPDRATLACRYESESTSVVASIDVELYVAESGEIALRIRRVRAGALPVPLMDVLDGITEAVSATGWRLRWQQVEGDPVALLTIPPTLGSHSMLYHLETLELREGEIYLAGRTERTDASPSDEPTAQPPRVAGRSSWKTKSQR